ncbi:MAG: hypothetical protein DRN20_01360 [Thermoplasmata archaeon]|nr:MAG: hypothetical protein DRN20_01360 [Thermoplasmata archaeon]
MIKMRVGNAVLKVSGGKMIKVRVGIDDGKICQITISGDFFLHPENKIFDLENMLMGKECESVERCVGEWAKDVVIVGATAEDFKHVILMAINRAK